MSRRFVTDTIVSRTADTVSFTTTGQEIATIRNYSLQAIWTETTISGASVEIQASDDNLNWSSIASTSQPISSDDNFLWNFSDANYRYFRFSVTIGGGTLDTFVGIYNAKDTKTMFRYIVFEGGNDLIMDVTFVSDKTTREIVDLAAIKFPLDNKTNFRVSGPISGADVTRRQTDQSNGDMTTFNGSVHGRKTIASWKTRFETDYPEKFQTVFP